MNGGAKENSQGAQLGQSVSETAGGIIKSALGQNRLPYNEEYNYQTSVRSFGYSVKTLPDNSILFDRSGTINKIDRIGDPFLRTHGDDGTIKRPLETLRRHPKMLLRRLMSGPKRSRGEPAAVANNAKRLGLDSVYQPSPDGRGIIVLKPEVFTKGINLQDIYNVENSALQEIDRVAAAKTAADYIHQIHEQYGAIGELHVTDIIFQQKEGNKVSNPILNLPDIVFNPSKYSKEDLVRKTEPKAIDVFELLLALGVEEYKKTSDWEKAGEVMKSATEGYGDKTVLEAVGSFAKRGRLTLPGDESFLNLPNTITTKLKPLTSLHNQERLGPRKETSTKLRELVIQYCTPQTDVQNHTDNI